jgi:hypothetical protein
MGNHCALMAVAALLSGVGSADASVIDQQQPAVTATTGFQTGATDIAQTFTVGIDGKLDSISIVAVNVGQPLTLDLLQTSSGLPTSTVIASSFSATTGAPATVTFDFSASDIIVSVGEVLAFQPIIIGVGSEAEQALAYGSQPDPYTRGEMFYNQAACPPNDNCPPPTGGAWVPFIQMAPGQDLNFADMTFATTVDPIPEPTTILLLGAGLLGLGLLRRLTESIR